MSELLRNKYFSLNSLFKVALGISLDAKTCQFLSRGLKYATHKLNLSPIEKQRDKTLGGNYSTQYDAELKFFAVYLYTDFKVIRPNTHYGQDTLIEYCFLECFK